MQADEQDERSIQLAAIAHSIETGTYLVPAEDIANAIMSGPFVAYLRRMTKFESARATETSQPNDEYNR